MRQRRRFTRRGFALPAAIIALVLLSALVAGALFVATEELRAGRSDIADQRALANAEWALDRAVDGWDSERNNALAIGASEREELLVGDGDSVEVTATRVQTRSVWITARGTSSSDGRGIPARHTVAASTRLVGPTFPVRAALTVSNMVTVGDGGAVDGSDGSPPGWDARACADDVAVSPASPASPASPTGVAGIAVRDAALACGATCTGAPPPGVTGAPPVDIAGVMPSDSASGSFRDEAFGDETPGALAGRATIVLGEGTYTPRPSTTSDGCDRADAMNWGDPSGGDVGQRSCANRFVIVRVRGSITLAPGSVGQGVLIADGAVRVDAGARFVGVVMAGDDIIVSGAGAEVIGAAFAADRDAANGSRVAGGGSIRFSGCAVRRASLGVSRLTRTPIRWWAELR